MLELCLDVSCPFRCPEGTCSPQLVTLRLASLRVVRSARPSLCFATLPPSHACTVQVSVSGVGALAARRRRRPVLLSLLGLADVCVVCVCVLPHSPHRHMI